MCVLRRNESRSLSRRQPPRAPHGREVPRVLSPCVGDPSRARGQLARMAFAGPRLAGITRRIGTNTSEEGRKMSGLLDGKVVLVTGAAGGIGRATSLLAAKEGARVAVTDVSEEGVAATADLVRAAGGEAIALPADLTVGSAV